MANCFKVLTGNWDAANAWASTTGGAGGTANTPTSSDSAIFDTNTPSGTHTVNVSATCLNLDLDKPSSGTLTFAGSAALAISGSLIVRSATNITRTYTGAITYNATATGKTVTSNGLTWASATTFNGVGGGWTLQDAFNNGSSSITLTNGSLTTGGFTVTAGLLSSNNSNTRSLDITNSTLVLSSGSAWDFGQTTTSGVTFTSAGSTIDMSANAIRTFNGGGLTYNILLLCPGTNTNNPSHIRGPNTFTTLTLVNVGSPQILEFSADITITGTFTAPGRNSTGSRMALRSDTLGTPRTITANAVALSNLDLRDITGAGVATWSGTSIGNQGGNSGITFATPVTRYAKATINGNGWGDDANWTATSGGTISASTPICHDTAIFDVNSGSMAMNVTFVGNLDCTGYTHTLTTSGTLGQLEFYGNVTLSAGMTLSNSGGTSQFEMLGRGAQTLTTAGKSWGKDMHIASFGGSYTLQDDFVSSLALRLNNGTLVVNGKNITAAVVNVSNTTNTRTFDASAGTPTIEVNGTGTVWGTGTTTGLTFAPGSSTIKMTNNSGTAKTFAAGGLTYNNVWAATLGAGTVDCTGAGTFNDFRVDAGISLRRTAGTTYTIASLTVPDSAANGITLGSITAASHTWSKPSGTVSVKGFTISRSTVSGGATWQAPANFSNIDNGNNSGWDFTGRVATSDALLPKLTEVSTVLPQLNRTDNLPVLLTESSPALLASLSRSDSLLPMITEATMLLASLSRADTLATLLVDQTPSLLTTLSRSDTLAPNLTEAAVLFVALFTLDDLGLAFSESVAILGSLARGDDAAIDLIEAAQIQASLSRNDALGVVLGELAQLAKVINSADSALVSLGEIADTLPGLLVAYNEKWAFRSARRKFDFQSE